MENVELLAPAGDWESLEAAADFGADAVYVGGELLQLRSARAAFDRETLEKAAAFLHSRGKRLYVTVNSLASDAETDAVGEYARFLRDSGADAVIVSDLGVLRAVAEAAPELERHVSTQASVTNARAARVWWELGAKRIVLARELSLEADRAQRQPGGLRPALPLELPSGGGKAPGGVFPRGGV